MRLDYVYLVLATLAFISCDCLLAGFKARTGDSPVVAVGGTAVLRCHTSIPIELKEVWLSRTLDGNNFTINMFKDGKDQQRCDLPEYIGRTEVMRDGLAHGIVAFKLFNVSVADEGTYRCYLGTRTHFAFCDLQLNVTALGSPPRIDIQGFQDGGIKAVCRSAGWYPEPTIVNEDDDGKMKIQKEANGLYSIEYSRVIKEISNRIFSCMFRTLFPKQERETSVYLADDFFRKSTDVTTILLALALACSLTAAVVLGTLYTCRKNKQGVSRCGLPFCIRSDASKTHAIHEQRPASLHRSADRSISITIKPVNPKEEPTDCESWSVTQALLPPGPDSEDAFSAADTEQHHQKVSLEPGSSDCAVTGSEDLHH